MIMALYSVEILADAPTRVIEEDIEIAFSPAAQRVQVDEQDNNEGCFIVETDIPVDIEDVTANLERLDGAETCQAVITAL